MKKNEKKMLWFGLLFLFCIVFTLYRVVSRVSDLSVPSEGKNVLIVPVTGTISFEMAERILKILERSQEDPSIKGIVVKLNSPGGTVGSSQEIYYALKKLREKGVKIVASMGDIAASGAYYIASAADTILANPGTITGSIGVIMNGFNLKDLIDKLGVRSVKIQSGKMKDLMSPFREMTGEEARYLQTLVMDSYEQFIKDILDNRKAKISREKLLRLADGRIFTGSIAKNEGLVDEIGGMSQAKDVMRNLVGSQELNFVEPKDALLSNMLSELIKNKSNAVEQFLKMHLNIPLMYYPGVWQ